jgi:tetratricopeptide (TPR) repeat protein
MAERDQPEEELSFKKLFVPLTNVKAIHWIIFIGIIVYANMLFNGFVWDDLTYVAFNPELHSLNILELVRANSFNQVGQYRAMTALYFTLVSLLSTAPFFYHIIQLIIHIINSILLYFLFNNFFKKNLAFFLSLIFLIHPVQVESVSFIASADNILFFLFGMLALTLSFKKQISFNKGLLQFSLLELSLLSKESGVGFLFMIFVLTILFFRNRIVYYSLIAAGTILVYAIIRFGIGGIYFNNSLLRWIVPIANLSLSERLLNLPAIIFYYLKIFIFPQNLAIDQLWVIKSINIENFYFPVLVILLFIIFIFTFGYHLIKKNRTKGKQYIFFMCWILIGLGFYSQIIPLDATVADRWMYFPIVGFLGVSGFIISEIKLRQLKQLFPYLAILILTLFSVRTIIRNTNWSDNLTLFSHDAGLSDNFDLESNIGALLSTENLPKLALPHTLKSVQMYPYDLNLSNLGDVYYQLGEYTLAKKYYSESISSTRISIGHQVTIEHAYLRLSGLYLFYGDPRKAEIILHQAIKIYPNQWTFWAFFAISEYYDHDKKDALVSAEKAKNLAPGISTAKLYYLISNNKPVNLQEL